MLLKQCARNNTSRPCREKIANDHQTPRKINSDLLLRMGFVHDFVADDVLDSLIGELEVFLNRHSVFDFQNHDWERNDQAAGK